MKLKTRRVNGIIFKDEPKADYGVFLRKTALWLPCEDVYCSKRYKNYIEIELNWMIMSKSDYLKLIAVFKADHSLLLRLRLLGKIALLWNLRALLQDKHGLR